MLIPKIFSLLGFLGVVLGAFGAHFIKYKVSSEHLESWKTATFYLFVHVIVGFIAFNCTKKHRSQYCFISGIFIFCGSLYLLVLLNKPILGAVTPIGGGLFLLGWLFLLLDFSKEPNSIKRK